MNVHWDSGFTAVYFRAADKAYRLAWKFGAQPEELFRFPGPLRAIPDAIVDFWRDSQSGAWRMKTLESVDNQPVAGVWEYSATTQRWTVLKKMPTECECGGCPCADVVNHFVRRADAWPLVDLLESMRVEHHLQRVEPGGVWSEGARVFSFPSAAGGAIRVDVSLGDTYHAMAPLVYLNERGEERVIYGKDEPCYGQLAFGEEGGFLLVAAEYTGECARVVEIQTGKTLATFPTSSKDAVWMKLPPG